MSDDELRDELMTLLVAGHETTATALAWALERLVRHPDELARLAEEAASGDDAYADAVAKETLRLRPGDPDRRAQAQGADGDRRPAAARGRGRGAFDPPHAPPARRLSGPAPLPPGALPRPAARHLHLDPVRRRRAPLPGRRASPCWRCGWCCSTIVTRLRLSAADSAPERPARRTPITLAPARGARVVVEPLDREPARTAA